MVFHEVFSASLERYFSHRLQSREVQAPVPHVMTVARGLGTFWEPLVLLSRGSGTGKSNCGHPRLHVLRLRSHKLLNRGSEGAVNPEASGSDLQKHLVLSPSSPRLLPLRPPHTSLPSMLIELCGCLRVSNLIQRLSLDLSRVFLQEEI